VCVFVCVTKKVSVFAAESRFRAKARKHSALLRGGTPAPFQNIL
jgi:hypothetical protein